MMPNSLSTEKIMIGSVTRNTVSVQQNNIPQNSSAAVQTPAASPSKTSSEAKGKEVTERTNEVAQKTFEKYRALKAIHKFFSRVFTWIKEIPSKLKDIPSKIADAIDNCLDKSEDDDEDENLNFISADNDETPALLASTEKLDSKSVQEFLAEAISTAPLLEVEINKLKFKVVDDLDPFDKAILEIDEYSEQLSELQMRELGELEEKVKETKAKFDQLKSILQEIKEKKSIQIERLRKAKELNLGETPSKVIVSKPKKPLKPVLKQTNIVESIRNREIPPSSRNSNNNCYRNSVITLLWAYPDFFKLIDAKEKERVKLNEDFLKEMTQYNERFAAYEKNLKKYHSDLKKYESFDNELKKYNEACEKFTPIFLEFSKQFEKYKEEMEKWEATDKTSPKPTPPEEPKNIPVKPELVEKPPRKPSLPIRPFNNALLLDALQAFKLASESGNVDAIRKAADNLHRTIGNINDIFSGDGQEDASEFLNLILDFVGAPFQYCTFRQGLNEQKNDTSTRKVPEKTLQIEFGENPASEISLQDLIQLYSQVEECPNDDLDITKKIIENGEEKEIVSKLNGFTLQNYIEGAPKNLFFNLKRFYTPSVESVREEAARVTMKRNEMIDTLAKELIAKNPETYKDDPKLAKKQAEDSLNKESALPRHNPNIELRKHHTRIIINENLTIDLKTLLRDSDGKEINCSYRVIGFTIHNGRSLHGGHYTACVQTKGRWFYANDIGSIIREMSQKEIRKDIEGAYNILMERIDNPAPQEQVTEPSKT